jgi:hypothetical protein
MERMSSRPTVLPPTIALGTKIVKHNKTNTVFGMTQFCLFSCVAYGFKTRLPII